MFSLQHILWLIICIVMIIAVQLWYSRKKPSLDLVLKAAHAVHLYNDHHILGILTGSIFPEQFIQRLIQCLADCKAQFNCGIIIAFFNCADCLP